MGVSLEGGRGGSVRVLALRAGREACTPANLALCAVVALGWLALVGWTGAGPKGWQARICADLDRPPRACAVLPANEAARARLSLDAMRSS